MPAHLGQQPLQEGHLVDVVVARKHDELPAGHSKNPAAVAAEAQAHVVPRVPDPRVRTRIVLAHLARGVGGRIVRDDDLEILHGMNEQRVERQTDQMGTVVRSHRDADERWGHAGRRR